MNQRIPIQTNVAFIIESIAIQIVLFSLHMYNYKNKI